MPRGGSRPLAARRAPDGAWFVDLAPVGDPAFVPQALANVLGVPDERRRPLIETLERTLRDRRCLLLMDNCEHLLGATASLCDRLLRVSPDLRVLATSREPLGLDGEVVWRVQPLELTRARRPMRAGRPEQAEAIRLFLEHAEVAQPGFAAKQPDLATVAQVCQRLDGIPLAIELAAAAMAVLTPGQLLDRLTESPGFLVSGSRTAPPRHRTIGAAIRWSVDLLTPEERRLFARLCVFAGGLSLAAAEYVCAEPDAPQHAVLDALRGLVLNLCSLPSLTPLGP